MFYRVTLLYTDLHDVIVLNSSYSQGRGSGFPGRRRSRGGLGGARGARGRSRLKTQESLTVSPGVRKNTHTHTHKDRHTSWILRTVVCVSVCVCGAVPAEGGGGGGELDAQHSGDVLHLWPVHPQTGNRSWWEESLYMFVYVHMYVTCVCVCRTCVWCVEALVVVLRADCWPVLSVDSVTIPTVSAWRSV